MHSLPSIENGFALTCFGLNVSQGKLHKHVLDIVGACCLTQVRSVNARPMETTASGLFGNTSEGAGMLQQLH